MRLLRVTVAEICRHTMKHNTLNIIMPTKLDPSFKRKRTIKKRQRTLNYENRRCLIINIIQYYYNLVNSERKICR